MNWDEKALEIWEGITALHSGDRLWDRAEYACRLRLAWERELVQEQLPDRLRFAFRASHGAPSILNEAADEIDRLRAELAAEKNSSSLRIAELVQACKTLNSERNSFFDQSCTNLRRAEVGEQQFAAERTAREEWEMRYNLQAEEYKFCRERLMIRSDAATAAEQHAARIERETIERCAKVCKDDAILCAGQPGSMRERNEALFLEAMIRALAGATEPAAAQVNSNLKSGKELILPPEPAPSAGQPAEGKDK